MNAGDATASFIEALLLLGALCVLAVVVLKWAASRGLGVGPRIGGRLEILERLPLDARRSVVLVRLGERAFMIGLGDGSAPSMLAELENTELPEAREAKAASFASVLERFKK